MMASDALFALNGGCGYVLKPPLLDKSRRPLAAAIAERAAADPADAPLLLTLRVLSAHNLPKSRDERCPPPPHLHSSSPPPRAPPPPPTHTEPGPSASF